MRTKLLIFIILTTILNSMAGDWRGKKVAYLGDSMTDPKHRAAKMHYWNYLDSLMGIEPHVYARSGYQWDGILRKAKEMQSEIGDSIDAIFIWAGTNDYNHSVPVGQFYSETLDSVIVDGKPALRKHREFIMTDSTFSGCINMVMSFLKHNFPDKQIILMTPIHRGYAAFNDHNIQPDENFANGQGLYIEDYIDVLRRAATLWAVPLIDLYNDSGLFPMEPRHDIYFYNSDTDRLHPNELGHYRLARTIQARLNSIPSDF